MLLKAITNHNAQLARKLPLRFILVVPFVLQIFAAVGLTGYLSFRNGQKAVNSLATQLRSEVSDRIDQHLDSYLAEPRKLSQINTDAIDLGLLNPQDQENLGHFFWKQIRLYDVGYISFGSKSGEFSAAGRYFDDGRITIDELSPQRHHNNTAYIYNTDNQGNRTKLTAINESYLFQKEAWYAETVKAGRPIWSQIYQWEVSPYPLSISANYPVYDKNKNLIGVIGVDQRLSQISDFLRQLKVSPAGKTFILERDGLVVASSSAEQPFKIVDGKPQRLRSLDSQDPLIQATAKYLISHYGNLSKIKSSQQLDFLLDGKRQFVQVTSWKDDWGLDWLVVIAVPESDFMAQINANTYTTICLCVGALGLATILGIFTSRWITQPILRLSQASQAIASGDLNQKVEVTGVKEIRVLAQSFNQMAVQLRESFTTLEKTKEEAEAAKVAADAANHAKSEFIANVSHELRTPLNGILGYAQILQRDKTTNTKQQDGLNIIHQCGSHLLKLINDILDISKIEAQKLELYPTDFNFEKFLLEVCEICRLGAEHKEIGFSYQALNSLPFTIHADEKRLRQVLLNLLSNAVKFTDKGGVKFEVKVLDISSLNEPTTIYKIRFQVEDTGIGITSKQLDKIFLPFEQVGDSLRKAEGTGLGLAISSTIVEMMGGEIKVKSIYGTGSKFWFDLDLSTVANWIELKPSQFDQSVIGYQGEQQTILIVDDRWENRAVICNLLKPIRFEVIEASNGQEGFDKAREFQPNLIVTDLAMPVMDGLEMTQRLRELEEFKHTAIIASSALAFNFDQQQCQEAGCNDFLSKPVEASELLNQLQHYLELAWIYKTENELTAKTLEATTQLEETVFPTSEELIVMYKAAKAGYLFDVQHEANRLKQLDPKYAIFAEQILKLATEFEDEVIVKLIEPYLFSVESSNF